MTSPLIFARTILAFGLAFGLTVLLVPIARALARRRGLYAQPQSDRWHQRPVPKLGGLAMLVALAAALLIAGAGATSWKLLITSTLIFGVGLVDDVRPIRPATKLVGQMVTAALLLYLAPPIRLTGVPVLDPLLAFLWIVGITNAFNLLDNIDGLAAGVAGIAGSFFVVALMLDGGPALWPLAAAMAALVGVAAGFLLYNFHPAEIFMGDSGSHLLGFFIAGATLLAQPSMTARLAPVAAIPVVILLIPIFDTAFVALTRRFAGRSAFVGGRDHISHRLVALGIGERPAVLVLYGLTFLGGCAALGLQNLPPGLAWGWVTAYLVTLGAAGVYLGHIQMTREPGASASAPIPSELTSRNRAYEVAFDTVLVGLAYYVAFLIRFQGPEFSASLPYFTQSLAVIVGTQVGALGLCGKYRQQMWRAAGPAEIWALLRGSLAGVGASVIAVVYLERFVGYSRSVFAFDAVIAPILLLGCNVALGALSQHLRRRGSHGRAAIIYGAGRGGALAARELQQNPELGLVPIGFLDDDAGKRRTRLDGLRVLGTLTDLPALLAEGGVICVVVSIRSLPRETFDDLCRICDARGVEVRRVRFAIEEIDARGQPGVIQFPKQR